MTTRPTADVVVVAGAPGAGKSVLGAELARRWPGAPFIEFSALREFHLKPDWSNQSAEEEQLAFENLLFCIRNYVKHERAPVVVTDLRDERVQKIQKALPDLRVRVVTLIVNEPELRQRIAQRTEGFTDVDAAVVWSHEVRTRGALTNEIKVDPEGLNPTDLADKIVSLLDSSE